MRAVHHAPEDSAFRSVPSRLKDRRRTVEAKLALARPPAARRTPPPDGRIGADDDPVRRLREALVDLGPVFAGFGRYLSTRIDLLPRRDCLELTSIADAGSPMGDAALEACVVRQLGLPIERRFFAFSRDAHGVTLWTERHHAWLAPGVPVVVTVVRPDAADWLQADVPLLPLLKPWFEVSPEDLTAAIDDFAFTLKRRLDQTHQAAAFATLAADASANGGFDAPVCYRDHSGPGILTLERREGVALHELLQDEGEPGAALARQNLARTIASAWLRQAFAGRVVPFEFDARDIVVDGERLVLTGGLCEPHTSAERVRFLSYVNAVAADDPDAAAAWIVEVLPEGAPDRREDDLHRRLRQAVPFRDVEWSGDDRFAEHMLVQWRMARQVGWPLTPHHLHIYRGVQAIARLTGELAPYDDALLAALQDERLQMGFAEAREMLDPRAIGSTLDRLLQDMVHLPQKLDDVLTLAAEGRLRVKLQVPDGDDARQTRNRTILLIAMLVALIGLAAVVRQVAPAIGPNVERLGAVALLVLGGWLLVVAARL